MTDITKRLAEALHIAVCNAVALMNRTPSREPSFHEAHSILRQALIDYADETAAQEANVQGGEWVMVPREPTEAMTDAMDEYVCQEEIRGNGWKYSEAYKAMLAAAPHPTPAPTGDKASPQTSRTHDGKEFIDEPNTPAPGKECLACNGTGRRTQVAFAPAPASGEVTDAMVAAARAAWLALDVPVEIEIDPNQDELVFDAHIRAALEAATRARQGEGDSRFNAKCNYCGELFESAISLFSCPHCGKLLHRHGCGACR